MISFVLACMLWSKPELKAIQVPVSEHGIATMNESFHAFDFEATVFEERMNSIKITHKDKSVSSESYSASDYNLRSLITHLTIGNEEASLDCDVRKIVQEEK